MFHNLSNFCYFLIFILLLFLENFEFEFNFSNSSNFEKFLKTIMKIFLIFCSKLFKLFFSNQREKLLRMATLTFRVGDHIFFICSLKNHMTFFCDFWWKIFGNILKIFPHFWFKILKTNVSKFTDLKNYECPF
jgi:hypothetical protein